MAMGFRVFQFLIAAAREWGDVAPHLAAMVCVCQSSFQLAEWRRTAD